MGYSFQKYTEYRNINDLAFDEIPVAWKLQKVKHLFKIGRGRVISQEELDDNGVFPVYSSQTQNNGCLGYIHTYDFDCKQITWTTDGANAGTVFLREGKHNCTNVCGTLKPIKSNLNYHFYLYLLQYVTQFHKRPDTNGAKIMNGEMASISLCIPSDTEQQKIANFLDHETTKIDTLIAKQEKLIELLKEKRQAVISHAVTKGLNPDAAMKDSGVEWLGEVPENWSISKLRFIASFGRGLGITKANLQDTGIPCVSYGEVHSKYGFEVNPEKNTLQCVDSNYLKSSPECLLTEGDVVFADTSEDLEGAGNFTQLNGETNIFAGYHTIVIRFQKECHARFLAYVFDSEAFRNQIRTSVKGVKVFSVTQAILKNANIWLPPLSEQAQISKHLDYLTSVIDQLISKQIDAIALMKERKIALISAVVTGKVDVRDWKGV